MNENERLSDRESEMRELSTDRLRPLTLITTVRFNAPQLNSMKRKAICEKDSFQSQGENAKMMAAHDDGSSALPNTDCDSETVDSFEKVKMAECASLLGRLQAALSRADFVSNSAFFSADVVGVWAISSLYSNGDCSNGSWILRVIRKLREIYMAYRQVPEAVQLHLEYACWLSAPDVFISLVMYMKFAKDHEFWGNMILQDCKVAESAAEIDEIMKSYDAMDFSQYSKLAKVLSVTQCSANVKIRAIFDEHKKEMAKTIKHVERALPLVLSWRASVLAIGMGHLVSQGKIPEYPRCVIDIISSYADDLADDTESGL